MKSWVCLFFCANCSNRFKSRMRSGVFAPRYPWKVKDCPFIPDAINAKRIDDGPTSGTTSILCLCANATMLAPGSATPGHPASESRPTDFPSLIYCRKAFSALALSCSFSSHMVSVGKRMSGTMALRLCLALFACSTMNVSKLLMIPIAYGGIVCAAFSPRGVGIKYSFDDMIKSTSLNPSKRGICLKRYKFYMD